jgi:hypothetical protein
MSIKFINLVWKMPLNPNETLVLLALADSANDEGFCFPGYKNLIEKTKLSRATLAKILSILQGAGLFDKKPHAIIGEGRKVNTYQLLFNESWFQIVVQDPAKSQSIKLIESLSNELILKINGLRKDKKSPISSGLKLRKVQALNSKSLEPEHEPSYNPHKEPSLKDIEKTDKPPKPKKQAKSEKEDESELLKAYGIPDDLAHDFIAHRKTKRASVSKTVLNGFKREANKAGIPLEDAIRISIERGWQGFNASWDWQGNKASQTSKTMKSSAQRPDYSELWGGDAIESTATRVNDDSARI